MKTIFYLIAACAVVFTACQNDNSVNPRPTEEIVGKATITGRVKADLNATTAGLESVTQGVKVIAEISTYELSLNPTGTLASSPKKYFETTVSNTGEYSIEVEAGPKTTTVTLYFADFRADQTTATTPLSKIYTAPTPAPSVTVLRNQTKIVDVAYNNN